MGRFTGRLEAVDSVEVRPRVAGQIVAAPFEEGARVKKGQLLFQIDPRPFQAEVTSGRPSWRAPGPRPSSPWPTPIAPAPAGPASRLDRKRPSA